MKLRQKDLKQYRLDLLKKNNICPLCGTEIKEEEAALDHDHETGYIRGILHRSCNSAEGRIINWCKRSRSDNPQEFLQNILRYWQQDYSQNPVHPSHLTETEKEIKRLKKKIKKLKTEKGKQRIRKQIKELEDEQE